MPELPYSPASRGHRSSEFIADELGRQTRESKLTSQMHWQGERSESYHRLSASTEATAHADERASAHRGAIRPLVSQP